MFFASRGLFGVSIMQLYRTPYAVRSAFLAIDTLLVLLCFKPARLRLRVSFGTFPINVSDIIIIIIRTLGWTVVKARSADLVRRECPRPTARSHYWRIEAAEPSPVWCSQVCLGRPDGLLTLLRLDGRRISVPRRAWAHSRASLAGTPLSSRAICPKRPRRRHEIMSPMEDNPV